MHGVIQSLRIVCACVYCTLILTHCERIRQRLKFENLGPESHNFKELFSCLEWSYEKMPPTTRFSTFELGWVVILVT